MVLISSMFSHEAPHVYNKLLLFTDDDDETPPLEMTEDTDETDDSGKEEL